MNPFSLVWNGLKDGLITVLEFLHDAMVPLFGPGEAWGWAIIGLTLLVRIAILPLAIKQTKSMKGMQNIQPKVKAIQAKYKVDRDLLKKDPELYQKKKAAMNEQLMALYKDEGVNPASSCLPLLLQMPIFFALFRILDPTRGGLQDLVAAPFYFFTNSVTEFVPDSDTVLLGLGATVRQAGLPGYLLIVAMSATMFITQRQMMSRNVVEGPAAQQQKIMMYVFPIFLAFISLNFPLAVVLYWVTTNIWQGVQQWLIFRTVSHDTAGGDDGLPAKSPKGSDNGGGSSPKPSKPAPKSSAPKGSGSAGASGGKSGGKTTGKGGNKGGGHVPKRRDA